MAAHGSRVEPSRALTRERIDHLIAGLACIALTALAVVASLIFGFQALRQ